MSESNKIYMEEKMHVSCLEKAKALIPSFSDKYVILPGFCDVHVHFREPGFSYKETIASGSRAAARGGFTSVCTMPNLNPVPDSVPHIKEQLEIIERDAVIDVYPYGSMTVGQRGEEISDLEGMAEYAIAFSDDGKGVQDEEMMREIMKRAKALDKVVVAHCELNSELKPGGCIHDGVFAKCHGYVGINEESEWKMIERDIGLVREIGCKYHVCHVSTGESIYLIRKAKEEGLDITCETAPHYLTFCERDLKEHGRFKMNPPIRTAWDRDMLLTAVLDGVVDMIATDHAPHSEEEKSKGLSGSAFGVVGLETVFPVLYSEIVRWRPITDLSGLVNLMCYNPRKRFNIPLGEEDFSVWDLDAVVEINPKDFLSMGKATPYEGKKFRGKCLLTVKDGKVVYKNA